MKSFQIFLFLTFLAVSMVANAGQAVLNPSQDAYVKSDSADNNYGWYITLWIGHDSLGWLNSLMQFDLSFYSGVVVESAYLRLYVVTQGGDFPLTDVWIARITESWGEMDVTWNNMPGEDDSTYISGPDYVLDWWVIDVASYVGEWVSGSHDNYGFMLGNNYSGYDYFYMWSRELSDPDYRPQLELNYHDVSVQPTSLGSIKAIYK